MTTRFIYPGDALPYVAAANIAVNAIVVVKAMIGVAATDIGAGNTGTILVDGVFNLPKAAGTAMPAGTKVTWSVAAGAVIIGAGVAGDVLNCGIVTEAAALADTTARVLLDAGMGTAV